MNAVVQRALDHLENNLQALIESVSSYSPSPAAAAALVAADDQVTSSLEQLEEHQNNYRRILALRATSSSLDEQLTELLTSLSETRQALRSVPSTSFPPSRDVPYDELLSYASKISRFTRPSNPVAFKKLMTPLMQLEEAPAPAAGESTEVPADAPAEKKKELPMGMTEDELHELDPSSQFPFTPWPSEEVMKHGQIFGVIPRREEPAPPAEEKKVEEVKEVKVDGARNGVAAEAPPQQRPTAPPPRPQAPTMSLGMDLYVSDEED